MIKKTNIKQLSIEEFDHGLSGMGLSADNRWVVLSKLVDWETIEKVYNQKFNPRMGPPATNSRIVVGAMIIKHIEGLGDKRTIEAIQENFYMQYFLGLKSYVAKPMFDSSLFVALRKRITEDDFSQWMEAILVKQRMLESSDDKADDGSKDSSSDSDGPDKLRSPGDESSDNAPKHVHLSDI
jgi:hypothetical protein